MPRLLPIGGVMLPRIEHKVIDGVECKRCCTCKQWKPLASFNKCKSGWDGLRPQCKECIAACNAAYRAEHKVDWAAYYAEHKEKRAAQKAQCDLKRKYGITKKEYSKQLLYQGGVCILCGKTPEENGQRLAVDHNHDTLKLRGLLCKVCNFGRFGGQIYWDNADYLRKRADYVESDGVWYCEAYAPRPKKRGRKKK